MTTRLKIFSPHYQIAFHKVCPNLPSEYEYMMCYFSCFSSALGINFLKLFLIVLIFISLITNVI